MFDIFAISILTIGFILGLEHATDADHVVAVSTIVSKSKELKKASSLGIFWGFGHTLTLLIVGIIVLSFKLTIPENMALSMEFLVGVVLVVLGFSVLREFIAKKIHLHKHKHNEKVHLHLHSHGEKENHEHKHEFKHEYKSLIVGLFHGLAGSSVLMILVLTTINSFFEGIAYILIFGFGSILGMLLISTMIGIPFTYTANKFEKFNEKIRIVAGCISVILGISIMVEIAVLI